MDYVQAVNYIKEIGKYGSVLGLDTIERLLERLGNPQEALKIVHFAGTNGKGSTITFVDSILRQAGYSVGKYMSPAVFEYREIIQIDGNYIAKEEFADILTTVADAADAMEREGVPHPTSFEVETAVAFMYFKIKKCDVVLLETGMGGETDATNVVRNVLLSVITSISLDHMQFLGNTVEEIAEVKAGIIKNAPVVVSSQGEGVVNVIRKRANKKGVDVIVSDDHVKYKLGMNAGYQQLNAATALRVIEVLLKKGYEISEKDIADGFEKAVIGGRFETISTNPLIVIDGAHNPDAALKLRETLEMCFTNARITFIMGVLADKDYEKVAETVIPLGVNVITVSTQGTRGLDSAKLAQTASGYCDDVYAADSLKDAVDRARMCVCTGRTDMIVVFGSLSYLGDVKRLSDVYKC